MWHGRSTIWDGRSTIWHGRNWKKEASTCRLVFLGKHVRYECVMRFGKLTRTVVHSLCPGRRISGNTVDAALQTASDCGVTVALLRLARLHRTSNLLA